MPSTRALYTHVYTGTVIQAINWPPSPPGRSPRWSSPVRTAWCRARPRAEGRPSRVLPGIRRLRRDAGVRPVCPGPGPGPDRPRHRRGARVDDHRAAGRPARGGPREATSASASPAPPRSSPWCRRAWPSRGRSRGSRPTRGARDHVEPAHQHRRGVLAHRLANGLLPHHRRGAGLRLRAPGPPRQLARALAARDAGLQPHAPPGGPGPSWSGSRPRPSSPATS